MCRECERFEWDPAGRPRVTGALFGLDILSDGGEGGRPVQVLFIEDDGFWHVSTSFHPHWFTDLQTVVNQYALRP